jgi:polyhydroxybutyrate depolymerase
VLAFHGGGSEPATFQEYAGLDAVADREGFLVAYPYGTGPLPRRILTWNGGGCCGYAMEHGIDDVGFAVALLESLVERSRIDPRRVYATGHSNGSMMAYRLGAERADRVAAVAGVAGAMNLDRFDPARAVPILHIHSLDDPRAPYEGGLGPPFPLTDQRSEHRGVQEMLDRWIAHDGCAPEPEVGAPLRGAPGTEDEGHTATRLVWRPCREGAEVVHWRLTGAGHGWPGGRTDRAGAERLVGPRTTIVDAAEEAWDFFARFSLPN